LIRLLNEIKKEILLANQWVVEKGLVEMTWGNVSFFCKEANKVLIKPSGIDLDMAIADDISVTTLDGKALSGRKPSVDLPTHLEIYKNFDNVSCVVHTHSKYATIFAQAGLNIPCLGTTHSDYFYGDVPCIPHPSRKEVQQDYELHTGRKICNFFKKNKINHQQVQACVIVGHGVFSWGRTVQKALENAYVLEVVSEMAYKTLLLNRDTNLSTYIVDKHFLRKNGENKYYGQ